MYSDQAKTVCPLTKSRHLDRITVALGRISTVGWTNITAGLEAAQRQLASTSRRGHVVLLSDGHHNTGADPREVATLLKRGAEISCVGIGGAPSDVDEPLMKAIASCNPDGTKRYRWIGDSEGLVEHFDDLAGRITRE